jgi:hypothetical protein
MSDTAANKLFDEVISKLAERISYKTNFSEELREIDRQFEESNTGRSRMSSDRRQTLNQNKITYQLQVDHAWEAILNYKIDMENILADIFINHTEFSPALEKWKQMQPENRTEFVENLKKDVTFQKLIVSQSVRTGIKQRGQQLTRLVSSYTYLRDNISWFIDNALYPELNKLLEHYVNIMDSTNARSVEARNGVFESSKTEWKKKITECKLQSGTPVEMLLHRLRNV